MERTFPQKVKPVPSCVIKTEAEAGQLKQALPETNRRVRKSAAMIGLALSVGAHGLLLSGPDDAAVAAEPIPSESVATSSSASNSAGVSSADSSSAMTSSSVIEHPVQEGQTLWQLARLYGVDASLVAKANGISVNSVLHVGQVLKVPASNSVALAVEPIKTASTSPNYYGMIPARTSEPGAALQSEQSATGSQDAKLKAEQDAALTQLQQKRQALKASLAKVKASKEEPPSVAEARPVLEKPQQAENPTAAVEKSTKVASSFDLAKHQVVAGDTLSAIARTYGVSPQQIAEANRIADPNLIREDQLLLIPQQAASSSGARPTASLVGSSERASTALTASKVAPTPVPVAFNNTISHAITSGNPNASALYGRVATPQLNEVAQPQATAKGQVAVLPTQPLASGSSELSKVKATVATAPFARSGSVQTENTVSKLRYDYVENLRLEIIKLREKYQSKSAQAVNDSHAGNAGTKVATTSLGSSASSLVRVNPELKPTKPALFSGPKVSEVQRRSSEKQQATVSESGPQVVAAASIGSQNYDALTSSLGKMVSPSVPPLGSVDSYLPSGSGKFAGYIWPAKGVFTSGYGMRWGRMHKGIDIAAPIGTPVVAAAPGVVITAGWNSGGYGNLVEIQHPDGSVTLYGHNDRILVREGQQVEQGQQIAEMGSTGYSTGPHSHFEVHLPGQGAVNPIAYLPREEA